MARAHGRRRLSTTKGSIPRSRFVSTDRGRENALPAGDGETFAHATSGGFDGPDVARARPALAEQTGG